MLTTIDHADLLAAAGHDVRISRFDPAFTAGFKDKHDADEKLCADIRSIAALQDRFYADRRYALLIIFQGMDTAGKDGAIRHVMSGVNPQGVDVSPFQEPSRLELSHDYLWRCAKVLPERGRIAIFNRSYYEELAIVRVHGSALPRENLPPQPAESKLWQDRYKDIVAFEHHLIKNGTLVLKFFLHVSKGQQRKRLLDRIDVEEKNWKISTADFRERAYWDHYQRAYELLLTHTSTQRAPWYIIPADRKWFTRAAVGDIIVERLTTLGLRYPELSDERRAQLAVERNALAHETQAASTSMPGLAP